MINFLATFLYNKIITAAFPWTDVVAGIVRTQVNDVVSGEETAGKNLQRYPVATVHNQTECQGRELPLIPGGNGYMKSMIYFEDGGINSIDWIGRAGFSASIRLIFWCHRERLVADGYAEITGSIEQQLIDLLAPRKFQNAPGFIKLLGEATRIPSQDAGIFSKYTYQETDKQYLRPPYDFFAIDFIYKFNPGFGCVQPINYQASSCF